MCKKTWLLGLDEPEGYAVQSYSLEARNRTGTQRSCAGSWRVKVIVQRYQRRRSSAASSKDESPVALVRQKIAPRVKAFRLLVGQTGDELDSRGVLEGESVEAHFRRPRGALRCTALRGLRWLGLIANVFHSITAKAFRRTT